MIHLLRERATCQQIEEMLQTHLIFIKVAVDIRRRTLAGGASLHSDCEDALLNDGSLQQDIWGANWIPASQEILYESLINIRPGQNNYGMIITDPLISGQIAIIIKSLLEEL